MFKQWLMKPIMLLAMMSLLVFSMAGPQIVEAVNEIVIEVPEDTIPFNPANAEVQKIDDRWKIVVGSMWLLDFEDKEDEARKALEIIQHYGLNKQCFVGRPDASMEYYLVDNKAPTGSMAGEDCLSFNLDTVEVKKINERWKIVDGSHWIMDFEDNEYEARTALGVIKKYKFNRICFVGRPEASLTYFKSIGLGEPSVGMPAGKVLIEVPEDTILFNPANAEVQKINDRWKIVVGSMWLLDFEDKEDEARKALEIIQHYGLNKQCFVGRPDASMEYYLVDNKAPTGSMAGEDCLSFNLDTVEVKKINERWKIVDGSHWIMDFEDNEYEARTALGVIKKYNFDRICFVGRPDSSMTYFKNSSAGTFTKPTDVFVVSSRYVPIKPVTAYNHAPGSEFVVDIQVGEKGSPVTDLFGVSCKLHYNTSLLNVVDVEAGSMLPFPIFVSNVDEAAGVVSIGVSRTRGSSGVSGYGSVATVRFRLSKNAVGSTTAAFSISDVSAINSAYAPILLTPLTASIHVMERLATPELISPYDNALANQVDLDYQWGTVTGVAYYLFELDNNSDFSSPEHVATTTDTVHNPTSLYGPAASSLPDDTYYWRVKACNTLNSVWSVVRSVRVTTVILDPKVTSPQTVGNEFIVDVHVGSDTRLSQVYPAMDLFGVSFSLFYDRRDILSVGSRPVVTIGSFLGTHTIMLYSMHDNGDGRGRIDIAISRMSGSGCSGVTGYGSLVHVKFIASGTATDIEFKTSDVGHLITAYNSGGDSITIAGSSNRMDIVEPEPVMGIWPGDTNNNGVVDTDDIFPIAMYFDLESSMRPGASLVWIGQPMPYPWIPVEATYADTNGDGRITAADVLAVGVNFGATHTVTSGGSMAPALAARADYAKYVDAFREMYKMLEANGIEIQGAPELKQALSAAIQTGVDQQEEANSPDENILHQSYPNPFNPECWIPYELSDRAHVVIRIYNIAGQLIKTLDAGVKDAGAYTTQSRAAYWDGHNDDGQEVSSGVYIYQLQVGDKVMTQRAVVCK